MAATLAGYQRLQEQCHGTCYETCCLSRWKKLLNESEVQQSGETRGILHTCLTQIQYAGRWAYLLLTKSLLLRSLIDDLIFVWCCHFRSMQRCFDLGSLHPILNC
jgi:hypothetical protein